jgi:hypothetical protein
LRQIRTSIAAITGGVILRRASTRKSRAVKNRYPGDVVPRRSLHSGVVAVTHDEG